MDTHVISATGDAFIQPSDTTRGSGSSPEQERKPRKRPRLTLACEECRVRKIRCDGERPICHACVSRHGTSANCLYQNQRNEATFSREYVDRLEKRIRDLESYLELPEYKRSLTVGLERSPSILGSQDHHTEKRTATTNNPVANNSVSISDPSLPSVIKNLPQNHNVSQVGASQKLDAMGNVRQSDEAVEPEAYGSSSTASFMRQLRDAVNKKVRTPQQVDYDQRTSQKSQDTVQAPKPKYCPNSVVQHCVLPPRHLADTMLNYYWLQGQALYPFLCKTAFMKSYESLWTGERVLNDQTMTYCILNVIFAIVSQFLHDDAPELRETTSNTYFTRAMQLLQIEILGLGSVQLIQALLIMGLYLQSTDTPDRCWVMVGIAIRVAQGLGLHLRETSDRMALQTDRELIRRIWHGCILMDRILSMTLGQPLMIGRALSDAVPIPSCIDDVYLSSQPGREGVQPPDTPSTLEFFKSTLELYNILEDILTTFYPSGLCDQVGYRKHGSKIEGSVELDLNSILRIDRSLGQWKANLPKHLVERAPGMEADTNEGFLRQANVLKLRYLHLQIMLFRPVLSHLLAASRQSHSSPTQNMELPLCDLIACPLAEKCIIAAQQILEVTQRHQRTDGSFEPLPAWWYKVFYIYSAATVLVAARIDPSLYDGIPNDSINNSWLQCFTILKSHSSLSKSARRCIAALEFLDQNIVTPREQNENPPRERSPDRPQNTDQHASLNNDQVQMQGAPELYQTDVPTYFGDEYYNPNLIDSNDIGWLHSVPMDLFQYDSSDIFRQVEGPFYNL